MDIDVEQLVVRIQKKQDQSAANKLVKYYYNQIFAFMYKQINDEHQSQDLTQEVFIKILKAINKYDSKKASFRTYLYRVAKNHITNYFKSKLHKTRVVEDEYNPEQDFTPYDLDIEGQMVINEQSEVMKTLILKLPEDQQQVIRLRYYAELSLKEIASVQEVSLSTVKSRLYQSQEKLRVMMIETEGYYE
ncbi:RNA polymerase sigma factor [Haloplasma contractile]|uniref:RNA polymerase sigma factor n=1 Tax=Haloplasma contractile SSD-17B TaxID=1033810 RepID=U2FLC8_9MOLU|nr:sigma-70 family RNA polymerase sigma factor [Haloplasma contractile]ERJ11999.1 RNA polymerase sigma-70 factor ECF family protein [Haloplasma contractile SSD-17B]